MIQTIAQWVVLLLFVVVQLFVMIYSDFHGKKASPSGGFSGFFASVATVVMIAILLYLAGSFDVLFGG